MKLGKNKKIILILILTSVVALMLNSNSVYAEINTLYSSADVVTSEGLEEAFSNSWLLEAIASLIYVIGRFLEWIIGTIFSMLSGRSDFPWADKIVFNSVALLDVNFINPASESFVGNAAVSGVLKNIYSTVLALSVSFFGIAVLITAIKLVISTIASEKAKYKQAVVDWLVGFVMLFCIHYFISFVFYLNEQLVTVASQIVKAQLEAAGEGTIAFQQAAVKGAAEDLIQDVKKSGVKYNGKEVYKILEENGNILTAWLNLDATDDSKGLQEALMKWYETFGSDIARSREDQYEALGMIIQWAADTNVSVERLQEIKKDLRVFVYTNTLDAKKGSTATNQAIKTAYVKEIFTDAHYNNFRENMKDVSQNGKDGNIFVNAVPLRAAYNAYDQQTDPAGRINAGGSLCYVLGVDKDNPTPELTDELIDNVELNAKVIIEVAGDWYGYGCFDSVLKKSPESCYSEEYFVSRGASYFGAKYNTGKYVYDTHYWWSEMLDDLVKLKSASKTSSGDSESASVAATRLIPDLATYFRYNSYAKERRTQNATGLKDGGNIQIQNMIMYAVLVVQSVILFIAYIKRLFYVVLLGMMAPLVVVYDFFQKFGK